jgi:hypothetical protein
VQASTNKIQEHAGRFSESDIDEIQRRADVITYSVLAELNQFQQLRATDFRLYFRAFLAAQIHFYREVGLETAFLRAQIHFYREVGLDTALA